MMMGRSQASEMKALPALLGFACLCVVVFFAGNFQAPIRAFFAEYLTPPADAEYASLSRSEVEQRLKDAEEALERVKYQSVLYGLVVEENKNLRRVEGIESITTSVSARVLSRPPRTHYDTLIVGAGSAQGVAVHDLAMWDGVLLGEAILSALGDKRGIERYGFCLPMDDCLAQVALDFGGRPWLVWDAEFKREKIGEMPTEMFMHFFKSFSDASRSNLNIQATGTNEHHKIESIFKCFAQLLRRKPLSLQNFIRF
jgi:hypothetical protein